MPLKKTLPALLAGILAVLFLDFSLNALSGIFYPRLFLGDTVLGWKYRPEIRTVRHSPGNGPYEIHTNREGFRDDEFKEGGDCFRVMVLGDSMTFGFDVTQDKIFTVLLEKKLRQERPGACVDVMNFGVTGYGTEQEFRVLEKYGKRYRPDVVFLMLFEANDFDNNFTDFYAGRFMPHYELAGDKWHLIKRSGVFAGFRSWLTDHSLLFYLAGLQISTAVRPGFKIPSEAQTAGLMKEILEKMCQQAAGLGSRLEVFYLTEDVGGNTLFNEIRLFADENKIRFHTVLLSDEERLEGSGHWNELGHARMAERLERVIKEA